jgi:GTP pyrophosphokinase
MHYKYKNGATEESGLDVWLNFTKKLENSETNADFVEDFKMNLYSKEIVFTPKEIKSLPKYIT